MYKKGRVNSNSRIISTDEDPSLRIESSAIINLRGVSTKLSKYMNEFVSPYTQYLYYHFNGYNSTRSLIQNRCTACLQGLLTINRNVNTCCQIIVNRIIFAVFSYLPFTGK